MDESEIAKPIAAAVRGADSADAAAVSAMVAARPAYQRD
jgi:hypothetical protein